MDKIQRYLHELSTAESPVARKIGSVITFVRLEATTGAAQRPLDMAVDRYLLLAEKDPEALPLNDIPRLIEAIAGLIWPILAAFLVWRLFPIVHEIAKSRSFSIKVGGMELTVQEATEQLRLSLEDLQQKVRELRSQPGEEVSAASLVREGENLPPRRILWVDDNPTNNAFEITYLRNKGIEVVELTSTDDAIRALVGNQVPVCAVISDMVRREGGTRNYRAGINLVRQLREANLELPIFIYSSTKALAHSREEVLKVGANGATASSVELYELLREPLRLAV